jgi:RNA polymerase sigma factor (sigma-70 family)
MKPPGQMSVRRLSEESGVDVDQAIGRETRWVSTKPVDDDILIVHRIAGGDRQAVVELYARFREPIFRYLLQLTPDRGLAEELLQDTLVAVWKSANSFEGRSSVSTWLLGIARRQAHNTQRQRGLPVTDESALAALPAPSSDPEAIVLAGLAQEELIAAFDRLAPVHREVLILVFVQQLSYQQVAEVLAVPTGTVKSRLSNARRALRALLDSGKEECP